MKGKAINMKRANKEAPGGELKYENETEMLRRKNGSVDGSDVGHDEIHDIKGSDVVGEDYKAIPEFTLLVWSARDESAIQRMTQAYSTYCEKHAESMKGSFIGSLAYTLSARRSLMLWRTFAVVSSQAPPSELNRLSPSKSIRSFQKPGSLAFVFTGQGAQYARMGWDLLVYPIFHAVLSRASNVFRELGADWCLFGNTK